MKNMNFYLEMVSLVGKLKMEKQLYVSYIVTDGREGNGSAFFHMLEILKMIQDQST